MATVKCKLGARGRAAPDGECYGVLDMMTDEPVPQCRLCKDFVDYESSECWRQERGWQNEPHSDMEADEAVAAWNRRTDHIRDTTKMVSNADRIRAMSDEELAAIICAEFTAEKIPFCQNKEECMKILENDTIPEEMCRACAREWLQQQVKED